jgi:uncharacterized protein YkwD
MLLRTRHAGRLASVAAAVALAVAGMQPGWAAAPPSAASTAVATTGKPAHLTTFEHRLLTLMNHDRTVRGLHPLTIAPCAEDFARRWTKTMAAQNVLAHNPQLPQLWSAADCKDASLIAENVGMSTADADLLYAAYMKSPLHRANILNPHLRDVGIGSWQRGDGSVYNTIDFTNAGSPSYTAVHTLGQGLRAP